MNAPFYYDYLNTVTAEVSASTVHCANTHLVRFFSKYLLQKCMSIWKWDLPENWDENFFKYCLYCYGFIAIINTDKYGVIPQPCTLGGYNIFYQPSYINISNPLLNSSQELKIGVDCELIKLQPDYGSIMDIVLYYADLLALCSDAIGMNLMNSKLSYVFAADNKASAETYKKLYDKIARGEVATFIDKTLFDDNGNVKWKMFSNNLNQNYITSTVLSDMNKIEQMFFTEIGIPNANTDKKERLIIDEVNSNNFETYSRCDMWLDEIKKTMKKAERMFNGLHLDVNWRKGAYNI